MHYKAVLFDLDGTLVETAPEIADAVNDTLGHLDNIFGMIAELRQVNTDGVAPMAHACDVGQRLRDDKVTDGSLEQRDRCLALAPESEAGLYLVPKVIE